MFVMDIMEEGNLDVSVYVNDECMSVLVNEENYYYWIIIQLLRIIVMIIDMIIVEFNLICVKY